VDRPVGVATGQVFSDGTCWIQQLAVARAARGQGLARALLLAGPQKQLAAWGAVAVPITRRIRSKI
jgi:GNAT superfamily N-acetyltransferase